MSPFEYPTDISKGRHKLNMPFVVPHWLHYYFSILPISRNGTILHPVGIPFLSFVMFFLSDLSLFFLPQWHFSHVALFITDRCSHDFPSTGL